MRSEIAVVCRLAYGSGLTDKGGDLPEGRKLGTLSLMKVNLASGTVKRRNGPPSGGRNPAASASVRHPLLSRFWTL